MDEVVKDIYLDILAKYPKHLEQVDQTEDNITIWVRFLDADSNPYKGYVSTFKMFDNCIVHKDVRPWDGRISL